MINAIIISRITYSDPVAAFTITVTTGERFEVGNPGLLAPTKDYVRYYTPKENGFTDINYLHVVMVEVQDLPAK